MADWRRARVGAPGFDGLQTKRSALGKLSWRDVILTGGGFFLLVKATMDMHEMLEPPDGDAGATAPVTVSARIAWVLGQIARIDLVFSLDSILTAVGMTVPSRSWSWRALSPWSS